MSIKRFMDRDVVIKRLKTTTGNKKVFASQNTVGGHVQKMGREARVKQDIVEENTYLAWFEVNTDIKEGDKLFVRKDKEYWDLEYGAYELPDNATPAWNEHSAFDTAEILSNKLHLVHGAGTASYDYSDTQIDYNDGFTMELRVKVVTGDSVEDIWFSFENSVYFYEFQIFENKIRLDGYYMEEADQDYFMDTTDGYHTYRITQDGKTVRIYVDDVLKITGTSTDDNFGSSQDQVAFYGRDCEYYLDYLYYKYQAVKPYDEFVVQEVNNRTYGINQHLETLMSQKGENE